MNLYGDSLTCVRGNQTIFRNFSVAVGAGEACLITGPNGSGKSSLLRILAGLLMSTQGHVTWNGKNIQDNVEHYRSQVHYIGHADGIKLGLSVIDNLRLWRPVADEVTRRALHDMGLADRADLPARMLSAGQKRRLALARLLTLPRPIWILDEPHAALDVAGQEKFLGMVAQHRASGGCVMLSTHHPLDIPQGRSLSMGAGE